MFNNKANLYFSSNYYQMPFAMPIPN